MADNQPGKRTASTEPTSHEEQARSDATRNDEIAARAYFIYIDERGGDPVEDWLRAERELGSADDHSSEVAARSESGPPASEGR